MPSLVGFCSITPLNYEANESHSDIGYASALTVPPYELMHTMVYCPSVVGLVVTLTSAFHLVSHVCKQVLALFDGSENHGMLVFHIYRSHFLGFLLFMFMLFLLLDWFESLW